jgi:glycosyltransferase involved in cell wall biosynthesis
VRHDQRIDESPKGGPRFSVVVPTRDRAGRLPIAVHSVLAQREPSFEVVVVDDGSTDGTEAVVRSFGDPRVRYVTDTGRGPSAARNTGARHARGAALVFLDDDDELLPGALETFGTAISAGGYRAVCAEAVQVSPDRRDWRTRFRDRRPDLDRRRGSFLAGAFALDAALFAQVGGYNEHLRYSENTELGWRVQHALAGGHACIGVLDEVVAVHYGRGDRSYDEERYAAARLILDQPDLVDSGAVGSISPRKRRATYLALAGTSASRLGRRREAIALTVAAVRHDPTSPKRYRNLLGAVLRPARAARAARASRATAPETAAALPLEAASAAGTVHGVVVTFNRPDSLRDLVGTLRSTSVGTLTVVDNAPSDASKEAAETARAHVPLTYLAMAENVGPGGGYAAGMASVLERAHDDDWILVLDDDGMLAPPETVERLRDLGTWLLARGAPVGAVGLVGARFDARRGRLVRPHDDELTGPVTVDYIAGGQLMMVRVAAAREVGVFDEALFFGFDDLDYCLRLRRHGYGVYAHGGEWREARRRYGRLGPDVEPPARRTSAWRRYYSVRNLIVIMRRYTTRRAAVRVTVEHVLGRPLVDLAKRREHWASLTVAGARAGVDAWTGRLGRRMGPSPAGD